MESTLASTGKRVEAAQISDEPIIVPENRPSFTFELVSRWPTEGSFVDVAANVLNVETMAVPFGSARGNKVRLNGELHDTVRSIVVTGIDIILGGLECSLHALAGTHVTDILRLEIRARRVTLAGRFVLPGCDVKIRCHTLVLKENGQIDTSAVPPGTSEGDPGGPAGAITIHAKEIEDEDGRASPDPQKFARLAALRGLMMNYRVTAQREPSRRAAFITLADQLEKEAAALETPPLFVARGAAGTSGASRDQPKAPGDPGTVHRDKVIQIIEAKSAYDWKNLTVGWVNEVDWSRVVGVTLHLRDVPRQYWLFFANAGDVQQAEPGILDINLEQWLREKSALADPGKKGEPANSPGDPGQGGGGGTVASNRRELLGETLVDLRGGKGGHNPAVPGTPPSSPAFPIYIEASVGPTWLYQGHGFLDGENPRITDLGELPHGQEAPARTAPDGPPGKTQLLEGEPWGWADAGVLDQLLVYLNRALDHGFSAPDGQLIANARNMRDAVGEALQPYLFLVDPDETASLAEQVKSASGRPLSLLLLRANGLRHLLARLDGELDSFGHHLGWLPRLDAASALSVWRTQFERDISLAAFAATSLRLAPNPSARLAALDSLNDRLNSEIDASRKIVSEADDALKRAAQEVKEIDQEQHTIEKDIELVRSRAVNDADDAAKLDLAGKAALQIASGLAKIIPWGQPMMGTAVASFASSLAETEGAIGSEAFSSALAGAGVALQPDTLSAAGLAATDDFIKWRDGIVGSALKATPTASARRADELEAQLAKLRNAPGNAPTWARDRIQRLAALSHAAVAAGGDSASNGESIAFDDGFMSELDKRRATAQQQLARVGRVVDGAAKISRGIGALLQPVNRDDPAYQQRLEALLQTRYKEDFQSALDRMEAVGRRKAALATTVLATTERLQLAGADVSRAMAMKQEISEQRWSLRIADNAGFNTLFRHLQDAILRRLERFAYVFIKAYRYHALADVDASHYELQRAIDSELARLFRDTPPSDKTLDEYANEVTEVIRKLLEARLSAIASSLFESASQSAAPIESRLQRSLPRGRLAELKATGRTYVRFEELGIASPAAIDSRLEGVDAIIWDGDLPRAKARPAEVELELVADREHVLRARTGRRYRFRQAAEDDPIFWSFNVAKKEGGIVAAMAEEAERVKRLRAAAASKDEPVPELRPFAPSLAGGLAIRLICKEVPNTKFSGLKSLELVLRCSEQRQWKGKDAANQALQ